MAEGILNFNDAGTWKVPEPWINTAGTWKRSLTPSGHYGISRNNAGTWEPQFAARYQTYTAFDALTAGEPAALRGDGQVETIGVKSGGAPTVGPEQVFNSADTRDISATTLANGNVAIAYQDRGNSYYGTLVIWDGTSFGTPQVFNSADTRYISATTLDNGSLAIAYKDGGNGTLIIWDGTSFGTPQVFNSAGTTDISATTLDNGNVAIAYRDGGNNYYGTLIIWDGSSFGTPQMINWAKNYNLSATTLANGNLAIAYRDRGNNYYGTLIIWDGTSFGTPQIFNSASTVDISATTLDNGNVAIAYRDGGSNSNGTMVEVSFPTGGPNTADFIGIAQQAVSASGSVPIALKGSVDILQSGLTAGADIELADDGTLSVASGGGLKIGRALTPEALLLDI